MKSFFLAISLSTIIACSSSSTETTGSGTASFTTWGEDFIEKQIDANVFADAWSVKYNKFLVVIRDIKVADVNGVVAAQQSKAKIFDMTKPGIKKIVDFSNVPAKAWQRISYQIGPVAADAELDASATDADKKILIDNNASVFVDAVATKGAVKKTYKWAFSVATRYEECKGSRDGKETEGLIVTNGGKDNVQLTIHGDHFYYNDLQSVKATVHFDAIARTDTDNNGEVTLDELSKFTFDKLIASDGAYGTGGANVNNLKEFVTALSQTIGHYRGEGECFAKTVTTTK
jgi:hypothetical protein